MKQHTQPLLACSGINKRFGDVLANNDVSLELMPGKIHALLGENGAGKSTLLSILSGQLPPDDGEIRLNGERVRFANPGQALHAGVGIVHQRFLLVEALSVRENILLGLDRRTVRKYPSKRLEEFLNRYGFNLDLAQQAGELSMGERQCVEILKLLVREANVLLFDEPTAVLPHPAIKVLFATLNRLRADGKAIVLTSHKLDEVLLMADTVTVMRKGAVVASKIDTQSVSGPDALARMMVGQALDNMPPIAEPGDENGHPRPHTPIIEVSDFSAAVYDGYRPFKELSFRVRDGEIFCVVGVSGNGQEELADVLAGVYQAELGTVRFLGRSYAAPAWKPTRAQVAYVPEDRYAMGTVPDMSLTENYLLTRLDMNGKGPLVDVKSARQRVRQGIETFAIAGAKPSTPAGRLSGGNLQKFLLFRELDQQAPLFIAANPTQGLDVLAAADIRNELVALKQKSAVLLFTADLDEALLLADRIAVMFRGRLFPAASHRNDRHDPKAADALRQRIGLLMAGMQKTGGKPNKQS